MSLSSKVYNIVSLGETFLKGVYEGVVSPLRIPTLVRRAREETDPFINADKVYSGRKGEGSAVSTGFGFGFCLDSLALIASSMPIIEADNYYPLLFLGGSVVATNLFSFGYERVRNIAFRSSSDAN